MSKEPELNIPDSFEWTRETAIAVGVAMEKLGHERALLIACAVFFDSQRVFHIGLPGSSAENDQWIEMKRHTVDITHNSSLALRRQLQSVEGVGEELPYANGLFAMCGGGYPLNDSTGDRGVAIVSGLPHLDDHDLVVEAIAKVVEAHNV